MNNPVMTIETSSALERTTHIVYALHALARAGRVRRSHRDRLLPCLAGHRSSR
ncbi:hypothetical protein [Propionivibrio sp.]|uniref:hypothetical protein n=1 Tax=Propionivibrio sp. TaxID=2212460 RepID=UPI002600C9E2|nr:hypothetical protein [Propionivibrio sp.]MBK8745949.1 hypothetical protein [Propionivibrio sp.]